MAWTSDDTNFTSERGVKSVIEEKVQIIKEDKILNLMTRIVVQKKHDKILGFVLTFDDITNLIAAQKMAAWSDIARRIAHEIKNPLTPIRLSAERLKKHIDKPIKFNKKIFEQSLNMITRQVDDIHHLVDEFSSYNYIFSLIKQTSKQAYF